MPGNDVDSLMINAGLVKFSPIVLHAASIYERSGSRFFESGVGTAITTISASLRSLPSLVAW